MGYALRRVGTSASLQFWRAQLRGRIRIRLSFLGQIRRDSDRRSRVVGLCYRFGCFLIAPLHRGQPEIHRPATAGDECCGTIRGHLSDRPNRERSGLNRKVRAENGINRSQNSFLISPPQKLRVRLTFERFMTIKRTKSGHRPPCRAPLRRAAAHPDHRSPVGGGAMDAVHRLLHPSARVKLPPIRGSSWRASSPMGSISA
jgi:hypothetical protein